MTRSSRSVVCRRTCKPKRLIDRATAEKPAAPVAPVKKDPVKTASAAPVQKKTAEPKPESAVESPAESPEVVKVHGKTDIQAVDALPECRLAGPYTDEVAATRQIVKLRKAGLYADIKSLNRYKKAGYKIVIPLQKSRSDMNAIAARLQAAGFTDYYVPRKKSSPTRILLYVFNSRSFAELVEKFTNVSFFLNALRRSPLTE